MKSEFPQTVRKTAPLVLQRLSCGASLKSKISPPKRSNYSCVVKLTPLRTFQNSVNSSFLEEYRFTVKTNLRRVENRLSIFVRTFALMPAALSFSRLNLNARRSASARSSVIKFLSRVTFAGKECGDRKCKTPVAIPLIF